VNIIPKPHKITLNDSKLKLSSRIVMDLSCVTADLDSARLLKKEIESAYGRCMGITRAKKACRGDIILKNLGGDGEGYTINTDGKNVYICGSSSQGLFFGVQTMRQIIRQYKLDIPGFVIEDSPSVSMRGLYFDITRGRIPTKEHMFEIIDRLSFYKMNTMFFYIEHCFPFEGFSEVWTGKGTITPEEILEIDEYAAKHHIELIPSIATFGHLYEVLQTKSFNKYCELENYVPEKHRWVERQRHHMIDVSNREAHEFIKNLIDQYYPLFRSKKFHVCMDENFDLGKGRSQKVVEERGKAELCLEYLVELRTFLKERGLQTIFWYDATSDLLREKSNLNNTEFVEEGMMVGIGDYDDKPNEKLLSDALNTGFKAFLMSGTQSWSQILNAYDVAYKNVTGMAKLVKEHNTYGFVNSVWGDEGHSNHFENSFPLVVRCLDLGWNIDRETERDEYFSNLSILEYGDQSGELVKTLYDLSEAQAKYIWAGIMPVPFLWYYFVHMTFCIEKGLHSRFCEKMMTDRVKDELAQTEEKIKILKDKLICILQNVPLECKKYIDTFINTAEGIRVMSNALLTLIDYPNTPSFEAAEELELWLEDFSRIWRRDNKESELHEIVAVVQQTASYMRDYK